MAKRDSSKLEALALAALNNHNAIALFAETRNAQDEAVAIVAKHNCYKALVEYFGKENVYGS